MRTRGRERVNERFDEMLRTRGTATPIYRLGLYVVKREEETEEEEPGTAETQQQ